jgi:hypothetical protein
MTARFLGNLMVNILKDFEHDVKNQLKNADVDSDDTPQLLCEIRDEAIDKFKKLERGLYNIHHVVFGPT